MSWTGWLIIPRAQISWRCHDIWLTVLLALFFYDLAPFCFEIAFLRLQCPWDFEPGRDRKWNGRDLRWRKGESGWKENGICISRDKSTNARLSLSTGFEPSSQERGRDIRTQGHLGICISVYSKFLVMQHFNVPNSKLLNNWTILLAVLIAIVPGSANECSRLCLISKRNEKVLQNERDRSSILNSQFARARSSRLANCVNAGSDKVFQCSNSDRWPSSSI